MDSKLLIETDLQFDVSSILSVYESVQHLITNNDNQISITSATGTDINSGIGRIDQLEFTEADYSILNSAFSGTYIEYMHNTLIEKFDVVRGRFMKLLGKQCYTYHVDPTWRLHIPLISNSSSIFVIDDKVFRMPVKGRVYLIDTTKVHSAVNMTIYDRLHIVYGMKGNMYEHWIR